MSHTKPKRKIPFLLIVCMLIVYSIWATAQVGDAAMITYPGVYQDWLSVIDGVINFDLGSLLAAGCLWPDIDFHDRLLINTLWPLFVVGVLGMTYWIKHKKRASFDKHLRVLLLLTFVVYSSVSSVVFQTFACDPLGDGIEYLRADYRIKCTDSKHQKIVWYAGVMVVVYPVGIPLLYFGLLYFYRTCRHAFDEGDVDRRDVNAQPIAGLWESYTRKCYYYEVIECARRVALTFVAVFFFSGDAAQIAVILVVSQFFYVVFEWLRPYGDEPDTWFSRGGHAIVFLSMLEVLMRKVDVTSERGKSQEVYGVVLVGLHALIIIVTAGLVGYRVRKARDERLRE